MKKITILAFIMFSMMTLFGQENKTINFYGFQQWIYQHPMMMPSGKWDAYYQNSGQKRMNGNITINEKSKVFKITYGNGESWNALNVKKKILNEVSDELGDVIRTYYEGTWAENQEEARLVITKTKSNGCIFQVYSRRLKDVEKNIDCFRIISSFFTDNKCFE